VADPYIREEDLPMQIFPGNVPVLDKIVRSPSRFRDFAEKFAEK
jgi:hypothetical protein